MKLSYIIEFLSLSESLNFTKTSKQFYIAQSALSRHIAALEKELGTQLFIRDTKEMALTPAGKAVIPHFKVIVNEFSRAKEQALLFSVGKTGTLKISVSQHMEETYLVPALDRFISQNPRIKIELIPCTPFPGFELMLEGKTDLVLMNDFIRVDDRVSRFVFSTDRLGVIVHESHPFSNRTELSVDDLCDSPIVFVDDGRGRNEYTIDYVSYIEQMLASHNIEPKETYTSPYIETAFPIIKDKHAIAIFPYSLGSELSSHLKIIPLKDSECSINISYFYLTGNESELIPLFLNTVEETFLR